MKPSLGKTPVLDQKKVKKEITNHPNQTPPENPVGLAHICPLSFKVWWLFRRWCGLYNALPHQTQQNVATSIDSNCKVRIKAVKLLYLGAKWEANFGPLVKDKWNICQFRLALFLGPKFQRGKPEKQTLTTAVVTLWSISHLLRVGTHPRIPRKAARKGEMALEMRPEGNT